MDTQLIERVSEFKNHVLSNISNKDVVSFKLGDISFDDGLKVHDNALSPSVSKKILSTLRVKENFFDYGKIMDDDSWGQIKSSLKEVNNSVEFWGKKVTSPNGTSNIVKLFPKNKALQELSNNISFERYFDMILLSLKGSNIPFDLKEMNFNDESEKVVLRFIDQNSEFSVFNDTPDVWKNGIDLTFDLLEYNSSPFFERLVCSNGMVGRQYGFASSIKNASFKEDKIQKELNRLLIKGDYNMNELITEASNHLRRCDISLNEFYKYRSFFETRNEDEAYNNIIEKYFSEAPYFKAYGLDPKEQTQKWKASATSGRNAYDFYNDLTWLASHCNEVRIEKEHALDLQVDVSNLFFKDKFDLEDVAPKVDLSIGKIITYNN